MTISEAFQIAVQRHQGGRLAEAEALYRQILVAQPDHADSLHLLGVIAQQAGRHDLAVEWIRRAIEIDPNHPAAHCNLGEAWRAQGRFSEAIAAYGHALRLKPDYAEANNNLGNALRSLGQTGEAIAAYRRAVEIKPDFPEAYINLGNTLRDLGRFDEAVGSYRRALEFRPAIPEVRNDLGNALGAVGQFGEAIANYRRAIELKPDFLEAHNNLGNALREAGQCEGAVVACRRALELKPDFPEARNNLGNALRDLGQIDEAIASYCRAIELKADFPAAHINLGNAFRDQYRLEEAIANYRRAIALKPDYAEAHNNLGNALRDVGQLDEAAASYRRAIQLRPGYPEPHNNLGGTLRDQGELDEAIASYRIALQLKPDYPEALNNLAGALAAQGMLDDAISAYRRALELKPDYASAHSNLVFTLHFHPAHDESAISEEHRRWNRQFSDPLKPFVRPHSNDRNPGRRLRIGYVSPDFREHVVGRYALTLLERHDRKQFEILCYSGVLQPDWMTKRFRALAGDAGGGWRNTVGLSDARLAEMIREDRVDILVDLAMHSAGNRLPMFCLRPAPVQVTWLACPGSTGLYCIDYRLTDAHMDPPGSRSRGTAWSSEEPVCLPDCWCCYDPMGQSPEVNPLPALSAKGVTFGSLNNFAKVHEGVLARWARVLEAVDGSRLLMTCPEGRARERVRTFFGARGIAQERVELAGILPRLEYLRLYQRIDLALDPFPYNGMTTTCDALWMGAPALTLPGAMPAARAGLSLLSNVGLTEFAVSSEEEYVRLATALAGNLPRLADLRATLRQRMQASPLMDAPRFARNVEAAYRSMWQRWRLHK